MLTLQKTSQQETHELQQLQDLHNSLTTDGCCSYIDVVLRIVFAGAIGIHDSRRQSKVMTPERSRQLWTSYNRKLLRGGIATTECASNNPGPTISASTHMLSQERYLQNDHRGIQAADSAEGWKCQSWARLQNPCLHNYYLICYRK